MGQGAEVFRGKGPLFSGFAGLFVWTKVTLTSPADIPRTLMGPRCEVLQAAVSPLSPAQLHPPFSGASGITFPAALN